MEKTLIDNPKNELLRHALKRNLFKEYKALDTRYKRETLRRNQTGMSNRFDEGRYWLFKAMVDMILFSPEKPFGIEIAKRAEYYISGLLNDTDNEENNDEIPKDIVVYIRCKAYTKKAGYMLWYNDGESSMGNRLVFSFIPWACIDIIASWWDGIGSWVKNGDIHVNMMLIRKQREEMFGIPLNS